MAESDMIPASVVDVSTKQVLLDWRGDGLGGLDGVGVLVEPNDVVCNTLHGLE